MKWTRLFVILYFIFVADTVYKAWRGPNVQGRVRATGREGRVTSTWPFDLYVSLSVPSNVIDDSMLPSRFREHRESLGLWRWQVILEEMK